MRLDRGQRRVWTGEREIELTFQEYELLAFDVHVSRLRHKLGPRYGQCLVTESRVGY